MTSTMSSFSSSSRSSFSSAEPCTPQSTSFPSSSSASLSPPGSLRDYQASLKSRHALGMAQAMKRIPLEPHRRGSDPASMAMAADDNPFDLLYSPTPKPRIPSANPNEFGELRLQTTSKSATALEDSFNGKAKARAMSEPRTEVIELPNDDEDGQEEIDVDLSPGAMHTGMLDFTQSGPIAHSRRQSDQAPTDRMPLSTNSSFEAYAPGDYFRMYGQPTPGGMSDSDYSPFHLSPYLRDSPALDSPLSRQSPLHPRPTSLTSMSRSNSATSARASMLSNRTTSSTMTVTSSASSNTITSLSSSTSTASSGTITPAQILPVTLLRPSRPSLLRPRPRAHPYDTASTGNGPRQRENSAGSIKGVNVFGSQDEQQLRDDGRSVSEVMVAMAGLRCQRGRGVRNNS